MERRGLTDRVEITGPLSESELAERYATVRFVVQTWHSPGFGLSPLEAAAQGTTFVMPTGQGSAELFRDGVDGLMFSPDDANALHRAVALLVSDPERAGAMGLSAWRHARARASWTLRARELADALADAAARS